MGKQVNVRKSKSVSLLGL